MSETAKTETLREMFARYNAVPVGRRLVGYAGAFGGIGCLIGIFVAYQNEAGFIVLLVLAFFFFLCGDHYKYAFTKDLSQRKVRRIDYWYLSAATIGLFFAAFGYSTQREATITRMTEKLYEAADSHAVAAVHNAIDDLSNFLCVQLAPKANEACVGLKKLTPEVQTGRTPAEIASISDKFMQYVVVPYGHIFSADQRSKDHDIFLPVVDVQLKIEDWKKLAELAPKIDKAQSKVDEETRIIFEFGERVIWPFLIAFALALRITKVTIDVFEWAK
jgi:hypothetical protein